MDIVKLYARAGFAVFPLFGKIPPKDYDWTKTPYDPDACKADFFGNYGVLIGPKYLVIDIDCKPGKDGKNSYKQLLADCNLAAGWESKTYVVQTGSGGFHIMLKLPGEYHIRKTLPQYKHIEWLSRNMYVVGPGSIHPETNKEYQVVFGTPETVMDCPAEILSIISTQAIETIGVQPETDFIDDDPLNVERFIELLDGMPEVSVGNQRNSAYIAACRGRDLGLSLPKCIDLLNQYYNGKKLSPPIREEEVTEVTRNAYKYAKNHAGNLNVSSIFKVIDVGDPVETDKLRYDVDKHNKILRTLNNVVNYIFSIPQIKDAFKYNVFSGLIEIDSSVPWYKERGSRGPNLCDEDVTLLKYFLSVTIKVEFAVTLLYEAIIIVAHKRHYHPIRNYLNSLLWDGQPRLDTWLSRYGHAIDTTYTRAIGRKTLCGAVRRVMNPGCQWDYTMIIEGAQGIGKSTTCRILGRSWCGDMMLDPHQKDSIAMMLGKWVIELSEMTALKWADVNALRSFLTRPTDTVRLAYERHAKDFPRQSIFIGTVNPEHVGYLTDVTGNRRYWVVRFNGPVDLIGLENDCDQLWAEARAVYETEKLYLTGEAEQLQALETQARMPEDPMRKNVINWMKANTGVIETTTEDVLEYLGIPLKQVSRGDQSRIAQALIEMGWVKDVRRENGIFSTYYRKPLREVFET